MSNVLSGEPLRQLLRKESAVIRANAGIRPRSEVVTSSSGMGSLRYFGRSLSTSAVAARGFLSDLEATGALKTLGFTLADFEAAQARVVDTQLADKTATGLAEDAHAEAVNARADLADMTMKLYQCYRSLMDSPLVDLALKNQVKDAGSLLVSEVQSVREERSSSRTANSEVRDVKDTLNSVESQKEVLLKEKAVRNAQKDLRLQFMAGEALRPDDLVVADAPEVAEPPAAPAEPPKTTVKRRKAKRP